MFQNIRFCLFLIFFPAFSSGQLDEFDNLIKYTYRAKFITNLLHKYDDFHIVIHLDNTTTTYGNEFLEIFYEHDPKPVTIYNHDTVNKTFNRPFEQKCLNLVGLKHPALFSKYLEYRRNVIQTDVVVFLVRNKDLVTYSEDYWLIPHLERAGNILVINTDKDYLEIFIICFYCGRKTGHLEFLQTVYDEQVNLSNKTLFPRKFRNFFGHTMKVAYFNYYPYAFCFENCEEAKGLEVEILKVMSKKMNFNYKLIPVEDSSDLFRRLRLGEFDFGIGGLSITPNRAKQVHFSHVFRIEEVVAVYSYKLSLLHFIFAFFLPFPPIIWLGIFLTILVLSAFIHLTTKSKSGPLKICTIFLKSILEQPIKFKVHFYYKTRLTLILIFSTWFMFCLLINDTYKSRLTSFLTKPPFVHITKLEDLLNEGFDIVMAESDAKAFSEILSESELEKLNSTRVFIKKRNFCEALRFIKHHKCLAMEEFAKIFLHSHISCHFHQGQPENDAVTSVTPIGRTMHAWPFKTGTPFMHTINRNLHRIIYGGLMKPWMLDVFFSEKKWKCAHPHMKKRRVSVLNFGSYVIYFILYFTCALISISVFVIELLYSSWKRKFHMQSG